MPNVCGKTKGYRLLLLGMLVFGVIACRTAGSSAEAEIAVVERWYGAITEGDHNAALATVADDAVIETGWAAVYRGQREIEILVETFIENGYRVDVDNFQAADDKLSWDAEWFVGDHFAYRYEAEAIVEDGKIQILKVLSYCGPKFMQESHCEE